MSRKRWFANKVDYILKPAAAESLDIPHKCGSFQGRPVLAVKSKEFLRTGRAKIVNVGLPSLYMLYMKLIKKSGISDRKLGQSNVLKRSPR
jgi:hypothetical protein